MYRVLYAGFDTLDVAFQGAFTKEILGKLESARRMAEDSDKEQPLQIGHGDVGVLVKPHGRKRGFRYVFINGLSGAIFAVKNSTDPQQWNLSVSVRALRLATLGYEQTKEWLNETLALMGFQIIDHRVSRIDFAVDILAPNFVLDAANFVCPAQAKVKPYWSPEVDLDNEGNIPSAVIRGRRFESVTIGTMPNRQTILYDKRRAAIELRQLHWFEIWGIDRDDPRAQVWRAEFRAGRDALAKRLLKRSYAAIEADFPNYLAKTTTDIRYVIDPNQQKNISRARIHPLWETAKSAIRKMNAPAPPPVPEARILELMRAQRCDMARKQAFGNLINLLVLSGQMPEDFTSCLPERAKQAAHNYVQSLGPAVVGKKAAEVKARLNILMP